MCFYVFLLCAVNKWLIHHIHSVVWEQKHWMLWWIERFSILTVDSMSTRMTLFVNIQQTWNSDEFTYWLDSTHLNYSNAIWSTFNIFLVLNKLEMFFFLIPILERFYWAQYVCTCRHCRNFYKFLLRFILLEAPNVEWYTYDDDGGNAYWNMHLVLSNNYFLLHSEKIKLKTRQSSIISDNFDSIVNHSFSNGRLAVGIKFKIIWDWDSM